MEDAIGLFSVCAFFGVGGLIVLMTMHDNTEQRDWIEENVESNYSIRDVEVSFENGTPARDDDTLTMFTIEGVSESAHHSIATEGYLNFDEQVVVIGDDLDGAVVPVDGSDAERVLSAHDEDET